MDTANGHAVISSSLVHGVVCPYIIHIEIILINPFFKIIKQNRATAVALKLSKY